MKSSLLLLLSVFACLTSYLAKGQSRFITRTKSSGQFQTQHTVTAIAIRPTTDHGDELLTIIDQDTLSIPRDPDAPVISYFISLSKTYHNPVIQTPGLDNPEVLLINSGSSPNVALPNRQTQDQCSFSFSAISQGEWRAGLPAPSYSRSFTTVQHVVVHHSAGSNTNTDYTQVVRDIYIYHTQGNGWSDIGYNYLISQDGTIYNGRDPDGGEQDNVMGAHFCGSNSTTMGICLLGNYQTATPTTASLSSLEALISYKIDKEGLNPLGNYPHAFGSLGAIIGHREGCNTSCPGDHLYSLLPSVKSGVASSLEACTNPVERSLAFTADTRAASTAQPVIFYNQSTGYDAYLWLLQGAEPSTATWDSEGIARYDTVGAMDVTLIGFVNGEPQDTLTEENYMTIIPDSTPPTTAPYLGFFADRRTVNLYGSVEFRNESSGYDRYLWLLKGADQDTAQWQAKGTTRFISVGMQDVAIIGFKDDQPQDTLTQAGYIRVRESELISPNPVSSGSKLQIRLQAPVENLTLLDLGGKAFYPQNMSNNAYTIPMIESGVYIIKFEVEGRSITKRVIILH